MHRVALFIVIALLATACDRDEPLPPETLTTTSVAETNDITAVITPAPSPPDTVIDPTTTVRPAPPEIDTQVGFRGLDAAIWQGLEHCGWQETSVLQVRLTDLSDYLQEDAAALYESAQAHELVVFVRDPSAIRDYSYASESDLDATMPNNATAIAESATPTGYALSYTPSDPTRIYVTTPSSIEAWTLATTWHLCL